MGKQIRLNAFDMNTVGHIAHGYWAHPRDQSRNYRDLDYWVELAGILERGKFDGLFLADTLGMVDGLESDPGITLREAVQAPMNDPLLLVSAMAHATRHLGFGVTANLSHAYPYVFARSMSTLDHLTRGRIGWNIVTGHQASAARPGPGAGRARRPLRHRRRFHGSRLQAVGRQLGRRCGARGP